MEVRAKNIYGEPIVVKKISRYDDYWKNRSFDIINMISRKVISSIPVPDNEIVCDSCNKSIETEYIILIVTTDVQGLGSDSEANCSDCFKHFKKEYMPKNTWCLFADF